MKPQTKIIDAQALAKYVEEQRDGEGNVKAADVLAWLIGANNHVKCMHPRYITSIDQFKIGTLAMLVDRTEYILLDSTSFIAATSDLIDKHAPIKSEKVN
jgi:hypothetical protein